MYLIVVREVACNDVVVYPNVQVLVMARASRNIKVGTNPEMTLLQVIDETSSCRTEENRQRIRMLITQPPGDK